MREGDTIPKWAKLPDGRCDCSICGRTVGAYEEYEAIKPKGGRPTIFIHTACTKKERAKE